MKSFFAAFTLLGLVASSAVGQDQPGVPAKLKIANGNQAVVFLQGFDGENVTLQLNRNPAERKVASSAIVELEFSAFDSSKAESLFNSSDFQGLLDSLEAGLKPSFQSYWPYMAFQNNLEDLFILAMKSYIRLEDYAQARELASFLMRSPSESIRRQAESVGLMAALAENDIAAAEKLLEKIEPGPSALYLGALVEHAKGNTTEAMGRVCTLIIQYPNDLDWMPQTELKSANLYAEMGMTNSAISTARQTKAIYAKTDIAMDAEALFNELSEANRKYEEAEQARKAAQEAALKASKARYSAKGVGSGAEGAPEVGTSPGTGDAEAQVEDDADGAVQAESL